MGEIDTCRYLFGELMGGGPLPCQYRPLFFRFACGLIGIGMMRDDEDILELEYIEGEKSYR